MSRAGEALLVRPGKGTPVRAAPPGLPEGRTDDRLDGRHARDLVGEASRLRFGRVTSKTASSTPKHPVYTPSITITAASKPNKYDPTPNPDTCPRHTAAMCE